MTLRYRIQKPIKQPFKSNQYVEVCDRSLNTMDVVKVIRAGPKVVCLVDGRRFRASDGWWIGETGVWPFPSIRHQRKRQYMYSDLDES